MRIVEADLALKWEWGAPNNDEGDVVYIRECLCGRSSRATGGEGGVQDEKEIVVENIELSGEGSGRRFDEFCELLRGSSGELDAVLIWEHGDSATKLEVRDGDVRHGDADLKTVAFRQ